MAIMNFYSNTQTNKKKKNLTVCVLFGEKFRTLTNGWATPASSIVARSGLSEREKARAQLHAAARTPESSLSSSRISEGMTWESKVGEKVIQKTCFSQYICPGNSSAPRLTLASVSILRFSWCAETSASVKRTPFRIKQQLSNQYVAFFVFCAQTDLL
jgi:hypothetical protein